jgi:hypothetical protein
MACGEMIVSTIFFAVEASLIVNGTIVERQREQTTVCATIIQRDPRAVNHHRYRKRWNDDHVHPQIQYACDADVGSCVYESRITVARGLDGDSGHRVTREATDPWEAHNVSNAVHCGGRIW